MIAWLNIQLLSGGQDLSIQYNVQKSSEYSIRRSWWLPYQCHFFYTKKYNGSIGKMLSVQPIPSHTVLYFPRTWNREVEKASDAILIFFLETKKRTNRGLLHLFLWCWRCGLLQLDGLSHVLRDLCANIVQPRREVFVISPQLMIVASQHLQWGNIKR